VESVEWTKDGWPVLAEKDGARWKNGGLQDYSYLRDYDNPLMWAKWHGGFLGGTLWTTTAVDESYEITAEFSVPEESSAGLYLFYNEQAYFGTSGNSSDYAIRIRNEKNSASMWVRGADGKWIPVIEGQDVSSYHHNTYNGFFALRPAYLLKGDATLKSFEYEVIE
jgi:hypothetical protein